MKSCHTDNFKEWAHTLHAGEEILLSGTVYTSRDAAHKRIFAALATGEPLPYPIEGAFIYYAGPTPAKGGAVGSCGPTTSSRMDAIRKSGGLYLCAIGGAGALASRAIVKSEVIAYHDLGCESVKRFTIRDFPLFVAIDTLGNSIFKK